MNMEMIVFSLIANSGEGRSLSMEAISQAKTGDFDGGAKALLDQADGKIAEAHKSQTALIQSEADGEKKRKRLYF